MTIKELYEKAKENGAENYVVTLIHYDYILGGWDCDELEENDIKFREESQIFNIYTY